MRQLCVWLGLGAGLLAALSAGPGRAGEKADPAEIEKLVKQLASGRFAAREIAQKELEAIGLPALETLKKAVATGDAETKRRAGEIVEKLEKQSLSAKVLAPTKLKLSYKDTPVKDAVADFAKKSGCRIRLHDPENALARRKLTLETGELSFWEAFDQFCAKAGLVEGDPQDPNLFAPQGGIQIQPGVIQIGPGNIQILPGVAPVPPPAVPPQPDKAPPAPGKDNFNAVGALQVQAQPLPAQVRPALPVQKQPVRRPPVAVRPQPGVIGGVGGFGGVAMPTPDQIILKDGKPEEAPTDYRGAARVQVMKDSGKVFGPAAEGEIQVGLRVSLEPKLTWQKVVGVRVDKSADDAGQTLTPIMGAPQPGPAPMVQFGFGGGAFGIMGGAAPAVNLGFGGAFGVGGGAIGALGFGGAFGGAQGLHQYVPVRLKKGEKASKVLKEFSGVVTAEVLTEAEVYIDMPNVRAQTGKTVKGAKAGGSIKLNGIQERNGLVQLRVELAAPQNVVPAGGGAGFGGGFGFGGGAPIQIMPLPAPVPLPAPAPAPVPPGNGFQFQQAAPAQPPAVARAQIQVQIGGVGGGFIGMPFGNNGLELLDEKGQPIPLQQSFTQVRAAPGGGAVTPELVLVYKPNQGQRAARLVFKGSKVATVEIPFDFKSVDLP